MKQELEIEYKNVLNEDEYQRIFTDQFLSTQTIHKIKQTNYYFDTMEKLLKIHKAAARIRISDTLTELTFKVPAQGFLMETNIQLDHRQVNKILNDGKFSLIDITDKNVDLELDSITNQTTFYSFNQFETLRYEKQVGDNLLVLDQTTFQNGLVDYELEVECIDPQAGKEFFNTLLNKYSIPCCPALSKIARAENNR